MDWHLEPHPAGKDKAGCEEFYLRDLAGLILTNAVAGVLGKRNLHSQEFETYIAEIGVIPR
jgi:hypothetical protein